MGGADPATAGDCLRSASSETLLRAWTGGAFVIGGSLLPLQPAEALSFGNTTAANDAARVRLLFGANADAVLARYPLSDYPSALRALEISPTPARRCRPAPT